MQKRILIAEDEQEIKELLVQLATRHGYDVVAVADGINLLTTAAEERFDVIITDLKMPILNGAAAVEIIKLHGNTTPIIALTAYNRKDLDLVYDKFTKIFYKPCDIGELFKYIQSLFGE
jgi:CheY-like chemotaxis protein